MRLTQITLSVESAFNFFMKILLRLCALVQLATVQEYSIQPFIQIKNDLA